MVLTYSGKSAPSAQAIADEGGFNLNRGSTGLINWGRAGTNTVLNPNISKTTNKRIMRQLFREHGVPMPKLLELGGLRDWFVPTHFMYPMVGRPDRHTRGRGFWLINNQRDWDRALRGTRRKKAATHFMEYIDAPHEYRVHVFRGKSIRISEKAQGTTGATAHGNYTTIKPTGNIRHVRKAAKQAVAAVGLDFGCVDVLADDENCWVLEVNAAPGLGGSMPRLYADTFNKWYRENYAG